MLGFQIPVILTRVGHLSGGTDSLGFHTAKELPDDERMMLINALEKTGWLLFREDAFQENEIPAIDSAGDAGKSKSTRLRNTLYVLYLQEGGIKSDEKAWSDFYNQRMEKLITFIKGKLE